MSDRIKELDYLKCIFIILMIIFHLVYIGDTYPYAKRVVYTFHMSAFLIISGYLANINKSPKQFFKAIGWIFIPYMIMEIGYIFMSFVLPVREKVTDLSVATFLENIFVSPIGPYWYLHTLILCSLTYYIIYTLCAKMKNISRFTILGVCFFIMSYMLNLLSMGNAMYFMVGIVIYQSKSNFIRLFQPSALALLPFVLLICFPDNLERSTLAGVAITYLSISFLLFLHSYIPCKIKNLSYFIGQRTLVILLFSPIFTILSKIMLPFLAFDPSGFIYMCLATTFTIFGCFAISWIMDLSNLSKYFFGTKNAFIKNAYKS